VTGDDFMKLISLRLPKDVLDRVQTFAERGGFNRTDSIRVLIERGLRPVITGPEARKRIQANVGGAASEF
jgi:metal-responsive CopG/Arc/MetJ family transcriptional regulator